MAFEFDKEWLEKVQAMREGGRDPYPNGFRVTHTSTQLHEKYLEATKEELQELALEVEVAGRVRFRNRMGKLLFLRVQDRGEASIEDVDKDGEPLTRGGIIQVMVRKNVVGDEPFDQIKSLDIGDFMWAKGVLTRTNTGELTVSATQAAFAGKIMQAFPDRFHGVADVETRSRMRYVDLFMNEQTRKTFRMRSKIIRYLRDYFHEQDFVEVETPMMQPIPGGANARPFVTHHNTLDMQLYLRVAPELYLKRLVVGGFDRVFEINRNFRNEGISVKHNPEFTMLEFYQAWATYEDLMDLTETLVHSMVMELVGSERIEFNTHTVDVSLPWRRADMDELIVEHTELERSDMEDCDKMRAYWVKHHGESDTLPTVRGKWWELYFDEYVEKRLSNPTFVTGYPTEISPLSRRNNQDPTRVDRFELFIAGWEIANAFSELNDPVDQSKRFLDQVAAKDAGDDEGMYYDEDYIRALSYGMPPTAGQGIGIDRLVMLLTGKTNIREVILFPTLRPESQG